MPLSVANAQKKKKTVDKHSWDYPVEILLGQSLLCFAVNNFCKIWEPLGFGQMGWFVSSLLLK
jgi:hypothetical protein